MGAPIKLWVSEHNPVWLKEISGNELNRPKEKRTWWSYILPAPGTQGRGVRNGDINKRLLTGALLLGKVTGTEQVTIDWDGLLLNPKLSAGFLIRNRVYLYFVSRDTCKAKGGGWQKRRHEMPVTSVQWSNCWIIIQWVNMSSEGFREHGILPTGRASKQHLRSSCLSKQGVWCGVTTHSYMESPQGMYLFWHNRAQYTIFPYTANSIMSIL